MPKEPKTGYNFFCDMRRPQLLVEFPEAKPADISKMLGEGWKQLNTAELRAPYELQASNDRARFAKECAELGIDPQHRHKRKSSDGTTPLGMRVGAGAAMGDGALRPTPALTAVDFYATATAGRYITGAEAGTARARFDALPQCEREGYEAAAAADALRHARESAELDAEHKARLAAGGGVPLADGVTVVVADGSSSANGGGPIELVAVAAVEGGAQATLAPPPARQPYKKFKPKTRKPTDTERVVLEAIDRVKHAGREAEEVVEGWSLKLVADAAGGGKFDLKLTAPDGAVLGTAMDVKRKFGMVLQEASEARAASKGQAPPYYAAAEAVATEAAASDGDGTPAGAVAEATAAEVTEAADDVPMIEARTEELPVAVPHENEPPSVVAVEGAGQAEAGFAS